MKRAIVLSGGGAKGAYQIGVWKALKKLHIKYDIVTGTSIGALNGMLMVQRDYFKAYHLWTHISFDEIYGKSENFTTENAYKNYLKSLVNGGIETNKIEQLVRRSFHKRKFYQSEIDYGIMTYNLSNLKQKEVLKKNFKDGTIINYIIASATCFPFFQKKKIEEKEYIDGGYYDNLPINLALKLGAEEIIAVDLKAIGLKQKPKKDVNVVTIAPRNKITSFLIFDSKNAKPTMQFGYNDTMKTYGKLDGNKYTFKKGDLKRNEEKYKEVFLQKISFLLRKKNIIDKFLQISTFKKLIEKKDIEKIMNDIIENLGKVFQIEESKIYKISQYNEILLKELEKVEGIKEIDLKEMKKILDKKQIVKTVYNLLKQKGESWLSTIGIFFPKELLGAIYLLSIENLQ